MLSTLTTLNALISKMTPQAIALIHQTTLSMVLMKAHQIKHLLIIMRPLMNN